MILGRPELHGFPVVQLNDKSDLPLRALVKKVVGQDEGIILHHVSIEVLQVLPTAGMGTRLFLPGVSGDPADLRAVELNRKVSWAKTP